MWTKNLRVQNFCVSTGIRTMVSFMSTIFRDTPIISDVHGFFKSAQYVTIFILLNSPFFPDSKNVKIIKNK